MEEIVYPPMRLIAHEPPVDTGVLLDSERVTVKCDGGEASVPLVVLQGVHYFDNKARVAMKEKPNECKLQGYSVTAFKTYALFRCGIAPEKPVTKALYKEMKKLGGQVLDDWFQKTLRWSRQLHKALLCEMTPADIERRLRYACMEKLLLDRSRQAVVKLIGDVGQGRAAWEAGEIAKAARLGVTAARYQWALEVLEGGEGDRDQAISYLTKLAKWNYPGAATALVAYGTENLVERLEALKNLADDDCPFAHLHLGHHDWENGDKSKALEHYRIAVSELEGEKRAALQGHGDACFRVGQSDYHLGYLEDAYELGVEAAEKAIIKSWRWENNDGLDCWEAADRLRKSENLEDKFRGEEFFAMTQDGNIVHSWFLADAGECGHLEAMVWWVLCMKSDKERGRAEGFLKELDKSKPLWAALCRLSLARLDDDYCREGDLHFVKEAKGDSRCFRLFATECADHEKTKLVAAVCAAKAMSGIDDFVRAYPMLKVFMECADDSLQEEYQKLLAQQRESCMRCFDDHEFRPTGDEAQPFLEMAMWIAEGKMGADDPLELACAIWSKLGKECLEACYQLSVARNDVQLLYLAVEGRHPQAVIDCAEKCLAKEIELPKRVSLTVQLGLVQMNASPKLKAKLDYLAGMCRLEGIDGKKHIGWALDEFAKSSSDEECVRLFLEHYDDTEDHARQLEIIVDQVQKKDWAELNFLCAKRFYFSKNIFYKEKPVFRCCKKAAELGHQEAMKWLAWCYGKGYGTNEDEKLAKEWGEKAGGSCIIF